jgi:hypothetical protein
MRGAPWDTTGNFPSRLSFTSNEFARKKRGVRREKVARRDGAGGRAMGPPGGAHYAASPSACRACCASCSSGSAGQRKRLKAPCTTADRCAGPLTSFLARQSVPPPPLCAEVPLPPSHGQAIGEVIDKQLEAALGLRPTEAQRRGYDQPLARPMKKASCVAFVAK